MLQLLNNVIVYFKRREEKAQFTNTKIFALPLGPQISIIKLLPIPRPTVGILNFSFPLVKFALLLSRLYNNDLPNEKII